MNVGDIVVPNSQSYPLHSGCSVYDFAIVVKVDPFICVSEHADMMWHHLDASKLTVTGQCSKEQLKLCMTRI